jgi:hypothetical protein
MPSPQPRNARPSTPCLGARPRAGTAASGTRSVMPTLRPGDTPLVPAGICCCRRCRPYSRASDGSARGRSTTSVSAFRCPLRTLTASSRFTLSCPRFRGPGGSSMCATTSPAGARVPIRCAPRSSRATARRTITAPTATRSRSGRTTRSGSGARALASAIRPRPRCSPSRESSRWSACSVTWTRSKQGRYSPAISPPRKHRTPSCPRPAIRHFDCSGG